MLRLLSIISINKQALSLLMALCIFSLASEAGQLYRYKNESGNTVLNRTIPPELVKNGYDILNEKGRLIERVPPALTAEQIAVRDAEIARQEALEKEQARQAKIDDELRQLYSHPNDAVRTLKRKVQDILAVIQVKQGKIVSTEKQIVQQESKAANLQRNGIAISENLLAKIAAFKKDIVNSKADIEELESEKTNVLTSFDEKIKRLEAITGKQASDYGPFLDQLKQPTASNEIAQDKATAAPKNPKNDS